MIRDDEIKRLVLYIKALGYRAVIRNYDSPDGGSFNQEEKIVTIEKSGTKTEIILRLLHEASHCKFTALNNRSLSDGLLYDNEKEVPKHLRKEISDFEVESLELMPNIASELNIKIHMSKILAEKEFDQRQYIYYHENGRFPNKTERSAMWKEIKAKWKLKKEKM